jgi:hypothetical protein
MTAAQIARREPGQRNAHLTYLGNLDAGRHAWLRLTPAYSVRLVRHHLSPLPAGSVVTDPFSGSGTTAVAAAERGLHGQALDINPFLVWLATARDYPADVCTTAATAGEQVITDAGQVAAGPTDLWRPRLANIERWWSAGTLRGLSALRQAVDEHPQSAVRDLLDVAFCRTVIATSRAAFNHQSMSLHQSELDPADAGTTERVLETYRADLAAVLAGAATPVAGSARVWAGDSRTMAVDGLQECDLLFTSPPYANRMSYIRELRPYMYWLRFLDQPPEAADLDWAAIGGTWGSATSRLGGWSAEGSLPIQAELDYLCRQISTAGRSGALLASYIARYTHDMWAHFQAAYRHVRTGGLAVYIIGNSSFYGHLVPVERWYQQLLQAAGFGPVHLTLIRKRNSNHFLFEYAVHAARR